MNKIVTDLGLVAFVIGWFFGAVYAVGLISLAPHELRVLVGILLFGSATIFYTMTQASEKARS